MPAMMEKRVLYVTAIGASANSFLKGHFRTLKQNSFRVALASTRDKESDQATQETGIEHFPIKLSTKISVWHDLLALFSLVRIIIGYQPHVIHAHMSKAGLVGTLAGWLCRTPHRIYHNHGMAYFSSSGKRKILLGLLERCTCRFATEVIFCSQSTMDEAVRQGLCPPRKATLLGGGTISGVDTTKFNPEKDKQSIEALRSRLSLSPDHLVIGFVGRIVPHKGIDTLIDAWERLCETESDPRRVLLICGKHDDNELYQRLVDATSRNTNIVYAGRQGDIANIYNLMNVLVLPSLHEGFPYSVLEAQSCGIPAIVTRVSGNVDAVVDGRTGTVISPGSAQELAQAMDQLLASPDMRRQYGENARQRVLDYYSQSTVLNNLKLKYNSLFSKDSI